MKRIAIALAVIFVSIILAVPPAQAQAPTNLREFIAVVKESISTAKAIERDKAAKEDFKRRAQDFFRRVAEHQANRCEYEEGHPEQCVDYDREAQALREEAGELQAEENRLKVQAAMNRSHYQVLVARLRIAIFVTRLEEWVARVRACTYEEGADEEATQRMIARCIDRAWEDHP